jgi:hypothetical protein
MRSNPAPQSEFPKGNFLLSGLKTLPKIKFELCYWSQASTVPYHKKPKAEPNPAHCTFQIPCFFPFSTYYGVVKATTPPPPPTPPRTTPPKRCRAKQWKVCFTTTPPSHKQQLSQECGQDKQKGHVGCTVLIHDLEQK